MTMQPQPNSQTPIVIYQSADGSIATEVRLEGEPESNVQKMHIAAIRNSRIAARKREVKP